MIQNPYNKRKVTTNEFPVRRGYFYIVHYRNLLNPKLLPVLFTSRMIAKLTLEKQIPKNYWYKYEIVRGIDLEGKEWRYHTGRKWKLGHERKYKYPPQIANDKKARRRFRDKIRRRRKTMEVYYVPKTRLYFKDPEIKVEFTKQIKIKKKFEVKAFGLDRSPRYIFILLKKLPKKEGSTLKRLDVIKIHLKKGTHRRVRISLKHTDLIRPYLGGEFYHKILPLKNVIEIMQFCIDNGAKFNRNILKHFKKFNNGRNQKINDQET